MSRDIKSDTDRIVEAIDRLTDSLRAQTEESNLRYEDSRKAAKTLEDMAVQKAVKEMEWIDINIQNARNAMNVKFVPKE